MGDVDKIWARLGDRITVAHSVDNLVPAVDEAVLVVAEEHLESARREFAPRNPRLTVVMGGTERSDSVSLGLQALPDVEVVAVHDAARPLAHRSLLVDGFSLLGNAEAAIPVTPLHDTIKEIDAEGHVVRTLDRSALYAAQTPQCFRMSSLRRAHQHARARGVAVTDDAALMEYCGYTVCTFPGDPSNFKITTRHDLRVAGFLLAHGQSP